MPVMQEAARTTSIPTLNRKIARAAAKSSSIRTSTSVGALAVPMRRDSLSDEIDVYADMLRPW
jgi:hypothetical protein